MNPLRFSLPLLCGTLLLAAATALPRAAHGQNDPGTGTIQGTVSTDDGAIPGAMLLAHSSEPQFKSSCLAQPMGAFELRNVAPGIHEVEVSAPGYRPQRIYGIAVQADAARVLDVKLQRGTELQEIGTPEASPRELRRGTLEGSVRDPKGPSPWVTITGTMVEGRDRPGTVTRFEVMHGPTSIRVLSGREGRATGGHGLFGELLGYMGGHYKLRNLEPGVYDLEVKGFHGHRPQRIYGVPIRAGLRTFLDVELHAGKEPEEVRNPKVRTRSFGAL